MAERYEKLTKDERMHYIEDCPICLKAYAILRDAKERKALAQLKFENCSSKTINGIVITINGIDQIGKGIEEIPEYHFTNINAAPGTEFGSKTPVYFSGDNKAKSLEIYANYVLFSDGTIWEGTGRNLFRLLDLSKTVEAFFSDQELAQEYRYAVCAEAKVVPDMQGELLWRCTCGRLNYARYSCVSCKAEKEKVFDFLDTTKLKESGLARRYNEAQKALASEDISLLKKAANTFNQLGSYKDAANLSEKCMEGIALIEKKNAEKEEAERKQREEQLLAAEEKAKKRKRMLGMICVAAILCIIAAIIAVKVVIPNGKYNKAVALMESGDYKEAIILFQELGSYKDSTEKAKTAQDAWNQEEEEKQKASDYTKAESLFKEGQYEEALSLYTKLGDYNDSIDRTKSIQSILDEEYSNYLASAYDAAEKDLSSAGEYLDRIPESYEPAKSLREIYNLYIPYSGRFELTADYSATEGEDFISVFVVSSDNTVSWRAEKADNSFHVFSIDEMGVKKLAKVENMQVKVQFNNERGKKITTDVRFSDNEIYITTTNTLKTDGSSLLYTGKAKR